MKDNLRTLSPFILPVTLWKGCLSFYEETKVQKAQIIS